MRRVTILDTSVASSNLGDQIIMEAVRRELASVFTEPDLYTLEIASHQRMDGVHRALVSQGEVAIAGGTNLLSSRMWLRPIWRLGPRDALAGLNVVLMGCGWYQYQHRPDPYSRWLLRGVLSRSHLHAVRETYAKRMLEHLGIENVVNTGCPTIWSFTPEHCASIPRQKGSAVVTALNSYRGLRDPAADKRILELLQRHYDAVHLWVQTFGDYAYARELASGIRFVGPSLGALDAVLDSDPDLDFVGPRLHAGIRALQKGRRTVIVEIDNRAREMGRDFGLPTVDRHDLEGLERMIADPFAVDVRPPRAEIERWREQFRSAAPAD
jgi:polysaccharide pyruvyl transferase WcaK-like protein